MLSGLVLTAFLMGLGGIPHCAAMCGAACAALLPRGVPPLTLLGRCLGYALLGAVAAASVGTVAQWGRQLVFVQPLWLLAQAAALTLGLYLCWSGAMPAQLDAAGQGLYRTVRARLGTVPALRAGGALHGLWPLVAGMAWAMLPCGLLYAALMVAALAPHAWGGALVMGAFALPGLLGIWAAPAVLTRLSRRASAPGAAALPSGAVDRPALAPIVWQGAPGQAQASLSERVSDAPTTAWLNPRWAVRLSGLMLAIMSAWALFHQIQGQWQAWCA